MTPETIVYRGAKLPLKILEEYKDIYNKNRRFKLNGCTSTSLKIEEAFKFMFKGLSKDDVPVLYKINNFVCKYIIKYKKLDNPDYSQFPNEEEVLLQYCHYCKIIEISEQEIEGRQYTLVNIKYKDF